MNPTLEVQGDVGEAEEAVQLKTLVLHALGKVEAAVEVCVGGLALLEQEVHDAQLAIANAS